MLTIKDGFNESEHLSIEQETKPVSIPKKINQLDDNDLIEKINKIKEEGENIRRENLLFSRYLTRFNTTKIVETYDEYEDENKLILEIVDQIKSFDNTRRYSLKKSSSNTKKGWTKVSINLNEHLYEPDIKLIEQERLAIASYEIEQTNLEYERMKSNAAVTLDNLDILYRTTESDLITQDTLNRELERRVDKYRADVGEEEFNSPYLKVPAELVISRINKRIYSRIGDIGLLRVNTTRLHHRIEDINSKIRSLDDLADKMDEIDIALIKTRKVENVETFKKIDRNYKLKKSSQYPLLRRLQDWRKDFIEQENHINDMKYKCELLQNHYERMTIEINLIRQECQNILQDNQILKNRIDDIMKVPSISDYTHIIEQTKILQHGIHVWTKRVHIAENLLTQLKQQTKGTSILPPLKSTASEQKQQAIKSFDKYPNLSQSYQLFKR